MCSNTFEDIIYYFEDIIIEMNTRGATAANMDHLYVQNLYVQLQNQL